MTRALVVRVALPAAVLIAAACRTAPEAVANGATSRAAVAIDSATLLRDLAVLADDSLRGRESGTEGNRQARLYIAAAFDRFGLDSVSGRRVHPFNFVNSRDSATIAAANVIGLVRGTVNPSRYIVVTAHYDHVGVGRPVEGDSIYNGADDNASGTAALLALAEHFAGAGGGPRHSILFVALDAEEKGLQGARAFVANPPVERSALVLNVNMDMVSNSARGELYAAGASRYPFLRPILERVAARATVTLRLGHDTPEPTARDDWTMQSDHGVFHEAGIPFVYFGVEDHAHYHRPSDELRTITPGFYVRAVRTVTDAVTELDAEME